EYTNAMQFIKREHELFLGAVKIKMRHILLSELVDFKGFRYFCVMAEDVGIQEQDEQELFEHYRIEADKGQALLRLVKFLMNRVDTTCRSRIENAIAAETVFVSGRLTIASYKVKPLGVVTMVSPDPPRHTEVYPGNIPLD